MKVITEIEVTDEMVSEILLDAIERTHTYINELLDLEHIQEYQQRDIAEDLAQLVALKKVFKYFTKPSEWYILDGFEL